MFKLNQGTFVIFFLLSAPFLTAAETATQMDPFIASLLSAVKVGGTRAMFQNDYIANLRIQQRTAEVPTMLWPKATNRWYNLFNNTFGPVDSAKVDITPDPRDFLGNDRRTWTRTSMSGWSLLQALLEASPSVNLVEVKSSSANQAQVYKLLYGDSISEVYTYFVSFNFTSPRGAPLHKAQLLKAAIVKLVFANTPKRFLDAELVEDGNEFWTENIPFQLTGVALHDSGVVVKVLGGKPPFRTSTLIGNFLLESAEKFWVQVDEDLAASPTKMRVLTLRAPLYDLQVPVTCSLSLVDSTGAIVRCSFAVSNAPAPFDGGQLWVSSPWYEMAQFEKEQAGLPCRSIRHLKPGEVGSAVFMANSTTNSISDSATLATAATAATVWRQLSGGNKDADLFPVKIATYKGDVAKTRTLLEKVINEGRNRFAIESEKKHGEKVIALVLRGKGLFALKKQCYLEISEESDELSTVRVRIMIYADPERYGDPLIPVHEKFYQTDRPSYAANAREDTYNAMMKSLEKHLGAPIAK